MIVELKKYRKIGNKIDDRSFDLAKICSLRIK
jgi:hypothetical protein